ncbi:SE1832 family protein [Alkalibacillus almallahensis]|uniref:SE1832 family protein n=1 Tax=Alkalibacillus almallahensis TaxID=1379154 RepID=UPI001420B8FD|nr:SE1832 family protein [Alkalibacillus almallahensis]NIK11918.1 ribosomal protein L29 [Alkalibacillus almallahensis]
MTKDEIQAQIDQLKMDYIRIQGDLDKMEANGGNVAMLEKSLNRIEDELAELRQQHQRAE